MEHSYIDEYSHLDSFIHRRDPRIKILVFFSLIFFAALLSETSPISFILTGLLMLVLLRLSRIPLVFVFRKTAALFPFILMAAIFVPFLKSAKPGPGLASGLAGLPISYNGLRIFLSITAKAGLSLVAMTLLISSTDFPRLLKAFEQLRIPSLFIMIVSFMYRYIFVLQDELMKMRLAKDSRTVGGSRWLHIRAQANMLGVLFVRAYERAEKVYLAMCSRGFDGKMRIISDFKLKPGDFIFLAGIEIILVSIRIFVK